MGFLLIAFVTSAVAGGDGSSPSLELPAVFSDHMVLQCDVRVPVWGRALAGQSIEVRVGDVASSTRAGSDGRWITWLDGLAAGGPHVMEVAGAERIVIGDVWVGEVWLGSGQSNMALPVSACRDAQTEIARADVPRLRMFREESGPSEGPQWRGAGRWEVCTPETAGAFSGTLYFFGRELHETLDVPIGLLDSSMGGSPIQSWICAEAQRACPALAEFIERMERKHSEFDPELARAEWERERALWKEEAQRARELGLQPPLEPIDPIEAHSRKGGLGALFDGKIAPLVPYAIRGVAWYQGEQNGGARNAPYYAHQLPLLVEDWREHWNEPRLPFVWVQLPNYVSPESAWPTLRECMRRALSLDGTGMVVTIDIGEKHRIHPKNKQDVGRRLAAWALGTVYGLDVTTSGPLYSEHEIRGDEVIVSFRHTDKGLRTPEGEPRGFELADEHGRWHPASARIEDDRLVVRADGLDRPSAVRYAWADDPDCNLYNGAGLPASPFTTAEQ